MYSAVLSLDCRAQQMGAHLKPLMATLRLQLAVKATALYLWLFKVQFLLNFSTLGKRNVEMCCAILFFLGCEGIYGLTRRVPTFLLRNTFTV